MIIGVPKEIKNQESRVGMTPGGAAEYIRRGHRVLVQAGAGTESGFPDEEYMAAGCETCKNAAEIYEKAEMILKVKEPLPAEYELLREKQLLFAFLHLAPARDLTEALLKRGVRGIAFETVQKNDGSLPLLTPMSEIAGRMAVQEGARFLQKNFGGKGILMAGAAGVPPAEVLIIGGGVVGTNAAKMALGLGARVTIADIDLARLAYLDDIFGGRVTTLASNTRNLETAIKKADLLIGAVLLPGKASPKLVSESMVKQMQPGSVIVDVAIDQGGSIETIHRSSYHEDPVYLKHGILHYAVANMPGAVPRTSTLALEAATLPYGLILAELGAEKAVKENPALRKGLNTFDGKLTCKAVAESLDLPFTDPGDLIR
ncbi:MAG: alanine dehydrogenase [Firmicutes bacterium]|nr:alanine dehydrogenase [Bacillota bacterium]